MNPEDMPKSVWKWLNRQSPPFLMIVTDFPPFGTRMYFDDDPDVVEAVSKAYNEVLRKRAKERMEKKK